MAPHSSTLAWKIPWTEEPGGPQSVELLRVGHDWTTSLSLFTFMRWRRKWQPTPVFLPGDSQGWQSLVGCHLWGRTESDMTEQLHLTSLHVWLGELDHKEGWVPKNWCFWTVVLEKTLQSSSDSKEIKSVNLKENQPWIYIERTDAEAEIPILWSSDAKNWLIEKTLMLGKIEGKRRRRWQRIRCWMASPAGWTWIWINSGNW